ncbi:MAG: response regulator [candidate division Zixibacteria bacterium]|nr:response regulator [candidate division Zixibacteria bacterium]
MENKILIIDDDAAIRRLLKVSLKSQGYVVIEAVNGQEGIEQAAMVNPELIILDLGLPDMDGLLVLKSLREWTKVPLIVLTVRDAETDKVALLDAGANDYLTKPFSVPELLARIRSALRLTKSSESDPIFKNGDLEIDFAGHIVKVRDKVVKLTSTEYKLLSLLAQNAGKLLTQKQLLKEVWGIAAIERSHYLRVYIAQLRHKLEKDPSRPSLIITEPGVGYRLNLLSQT